MKPQKTIIITGSHHTPAIELINQLKNDPQFAWEIYYLGDPLKTDTHLTNTIIPKLKINFIPIKSGKFHRRYLPNTIKGIPYIFTAIIKSIGYVKKIKPSVVVSFGGYVSVPIIIAAKISRIPSITHEQTSTNSLSTRINSIFVDKIALSFDLPSQKSNLPKNKTIITGNLLRSDIYRNQSIKFDHLTQKLKIQPLIYITGGAQGSSSINQTIKNTLPKLSQYTIIHQTGKIDYPSLKELSSQYPNYHPQEYIDIDDIGWIFHHAQLIISRSGANVCQEIIALKQKSILIPMPFSQQNEQFLNAQYVKQNLPNHTEVIAQDKLNTHTLLQYIEQLQKVKPLDHPTKAQTNLNILNLIYELI